MTPNTENSFYCSECSRAAGEQLYGTAPRVDVWLLLEYEGVWGAKSPEDSELPPEVKRQISRWVAAIPNSKFLFIRQRIEEDSEDRPIRFYVARSQEIVSELYRLDLYRYEDLLDVDIASLALGMPEAAPYLTDERLFAICTNGRRDVSCAKFGTPIYHEFLRCAGSAAWQCSHIGGHRFAPTMVCLPDGIVYGQVDPPDIEPIVGGYREGKIIIEKLRGRSCYGEPVQVADHLLREVHDIRDLPGLRLVSSERAQHSRWRVRFETLYNGLVTSVEIEQYLSDFDIFKDSGGDGVPVIQYRLVEQRIVMPS